MPSRKVPPDSEIHRQFWDLAKSGQLSIGEDVLARRWGVTTRTVRTALTRLVEQGRVVKPSHGGDLIIVDPDKWGEFRAEVAARSNLIDHIHETLWRLARQGDPNKVRVKNNHKLATYVGQKVLEQMVDEGRMYDVGDFLVVNSPVSHLSNRQGVLPPKGSYLTLLVEPEITPPPEERYEPVPIEPKRKKKE